MIEINRILIQLAKAVEAANSDFPQEKNIAVILFDNLIEVQLFKKAKTDFLWDSTTWYNNGRKHDTKLRKKVTTYYVDLLKYSKDQGVITEKDFGLLKYAHNSRNTIYHKGESDDLKTTLTILIYYDFLTRNIHKWYAPNGLICFAQLPGYEMIDFGQGIDDEHSLDYKSYFESSLYYIIEKLKIRADLTPIVQSIVTKQIEQIQWAIEFISSESKTINFYNVLGRYYYLNEDFFNYTKTGRKPKNIGSILLIYAFLREKKDSLDDIVDLKTRQIEGRKALKKFRSNYKGKYPYWVNLSKIEERVKQLKGKEDSVVLQNLIDIEDKIINLYTDTGEASSELDGYIQEMIDIMKGK